MQNGCMETWVRMKMRNNFLNVYRICLRDAEDDVSRSDDGVGDGEFEFSHDQLEEMLKVRFRNRERGKNTFGECK